MQSVAASETIARIAEWTVVASSAIGPLHHATDAAHLSAIAASMRESGWQGAPVVVAGEQAITGSHRLAAVEQLRSEGIEIEVPRIDVADLCTLFGVDWNDLETEYGLNPGSEWLDAALHLDEVLPDEVIDYLGIDIH